MRSRTNSITLMAIIPLMLIVAACGRKDNATTGAPAATPAQVTVADLEVGRRINSAHQIEQASDTFSPADTLWASVKTENTPSGTRILARWVYTEGDAEQIISEETHTTAQSGTGYTSFFAYNPSTWPPGSYEVRVGVDGEIKKTKEFHVES
jgi:hypothetical protein